MGLGDRCAAPQLDACVRIRRRGVGVFRIIAENLGRLLPMPVVVVPPAIVAPDPSGAALPIARDDRFTLVFMSDSSAPSNARTRSAWSRRSHAPSLPTKAHG